MAQGPAPLVHGRAHAPHALAEADKDRLAHEEMADIELDDLGKRRDGLRSLVVEAVAGMDLEAEPAGEIGAVADAAPFRLGVVHASFGQCVAPGADMDFDGWCPQARRRLDLAPLGGDEQRDLDAGVDQFGDDGREHVVLRHDVEAAFGGALGALLRHEAGGMGLRLQRDRLHLGRRRHFEVERAVELGDEPGDIARRGYGGGPRANAR